MPMLLWKDMRVVIASRRRSVPCQHLAAMHRQLDAVERESR
jgi:hypothetical protein